MFQDGGHYPARPFPNISDFHKSFAKLAVRDSAVDDPRQEVEELLGLTEDVPITFTHGDLDQSNILITKPGNGPLRIVSIIDWHQSGWYPEPWEWLKAQSVAAFDSDWKADYISKILRHAKYEYFYA